MQSKFELDVFDTSMGELEITFIGHGTLMLEIGDTVIHVDPYGRVADYAQLPKADVILVTHEHGDHLDVAAIEKIRQDMTKIIVTESCADRVGGAIVLKNGQAVPTAGVGIEAVAAYNIEHMRSPGNPYHPKGVGNGYILTFGDTRVYIAGDTELTPEMRALGAGSDRIDIAFLPMNLPYTMTPEQVAEAARAFRPRVLYPYHFGDTDTSKLVELLKDEPDIEVRIRKLS
jgi:L-ascorbate metabolism protein UlaG (beta-lactamase superfamily)